MDVSLPTGFILVVLSLSWLLVQGACLYLISRWIPDARTRALNNSGASVLAAMPCPVKRGLSKSF